MTVIRGRETAQAGGPNAALILRYRPISRKDAPTRWVTGKTASSVRHCRLQLFLWRHAQRVVRLGGVKQFLAATEIFDAYLAHESGPHRSNG
jgi:hypothetical protein